MTDKSKKDDSKKDDTAAGGVTKKTNVDRQIEDSFPASDPPSFAGGNVIGEPPRPEKDDKKTSTG